MEAAGWMWAARSLLFPPREPVGWRVEAGLGQLGVQRAGRSTPPVPGCPARASLPSPQQKVQTRGSRIRMSSLLTNSGVPRFPSGSSSEAGWMGGREGAPKHLSPPHQIWLRTDGLLGAQRQVCPSDPTYVSLQVGLPPAQLIPSALLPVGFGLNHQPA